MNTDLRIPVTREQEQLILEAAGGEPERISAWARAKLLQAAQVEIANRRELLKPPSEDAFLELAELWRRETGMQSSVSKKINHPAYLKIIGMGEQALPWILRELRDRPALWFEALRAITHQSPATPSEQRDPQLARTAWLKWGTERGLIDQCT